LGVLGGQGAGFEVAAVGEAVAVSLGQQLAERRGLPVTGSVPA
jgi:hypothetical protein